MSNAKRLDELSLRILLLNFLISIDVYFYASMIGSCLGSRSEFSLGIYLSTFKLLVTLVGLFR